MGMRLPGSAVEDFNQRELNKLRMAAEAGIDLATGAALFFCGSHGVAIPLWVAQPGARGFCNQFDPNLLRKRGRSSGPIERFRQDMIELMRFDTVASARWRQQEFREMSENLDCYDKLPRRFREHPRRMLAWYGRDWLRVYECASMILKDTPACGGTDAMKASYRRVKKNNSDPKESWRYFMFEPEFFEFIGVEHPSRWLKATKFVPLYDLTL
jgi:hypothetical protein